MSSGNLLFLFVLVLGPLVSISSSSWVICWVGLELSFLGAIPLLLSDSSFMSLSKESVIKYFCIQAMGSGLLMFSGVMFYMDFGEMMIFDFILVLSLFMKLGIFPMHFWVPSVTSGLNWVPMFILLGWQKIPPFALLINIMDNLEWMSSILLIFGGISALVGSIIGLNQTSMRAMLGSSSIAHTGWGCIGAVFGSLWIYFFIYCLSFGMLMFFCLMGEKLVISMGILSLSGLPPFVMFIGKWSILKSALVGGSGYVFLILPLLGALFSLFFYLKFFYSYYLSSCFEDQKVKYSLFCSFFMFGVSGVAFILLF